MVLIGTEIPVDEKGKHVQSCSTPRKFMRRVGSLWMCRCGQMWFLTTYMGAKFWGKADAVREGDQP